MSHLVSDLRFALRGLRKNPGFAATAILTLALGIGASTAVFAVVDGVLLEPLPFPDPQELVVLWETDDADGDMEVPWSVQDLRDLADATRQLQGLAGYAWVEENLTGLGDPERILAVGVTAGLLDVFRMPPALGRDLLDDETRQGAARAVLVSHAFWQNRLEGDPRVVGRTLQLSGRPHEVVGVAPAGFAYPNGAELWIGGQWDPASYPRNRHFLRAVGRLAPGATPATADAELKGIVAHMNEENEGANPARGARIETLTEATVGGTRPGILLLLGAVGMVLLIACANVANLLLARGSTRTTEMAVRSTLGASLGVLIRQLFTESVVLGFAGGGLGLAVATGALHLFRIVSMGRLPRLTNIQMDASVYLFAAVVSLAVTLVFGLIPAWKLSRASITAAIRQGQDRDIPVRHRGLARSSLLGAEVALSLVLLLGAGLLIRSFARIRSVELGFEADQVSQFTLTLPEATYPEDQTVLFYRTLEARIEAIPGVRGVGMINGSPMGQSHTAMTFTIPGQPEPARGDEPVWLVRWATPGYFDALGIPILRGRGIQAEDRADAQRVVVISESAARRFWPDEDPLGRQVEMDSGTPPWTVVGIARDIRSLDVTEEVFPEAYFPHAQWSRNTMTVEVLPSGTVTGLGEALRRAVHDMDPSLPLYDVERLQDRVDRSVATDRFYLALIGNFAGLALLLASVGLYGVVSYLVSRRTREIGVRLALGAGRSEVLRMVLGEGMWPVLVGLTAGLLGAGVGSRLLEGLLYRVEPLDPVTFFTVPVVLLAVALLAMALPAWRATRIAPTEAMRVE